jgi:hypothetical protein
MAMDPDKIRGILRRADADFRAKGKMYQANIPGDPHFFFLLGNSTDLNKAHRQRAKCWFLDGRVWAECMLDQGVLAPFRALVCDSSEGGREYGSASFNEPGEVGDVIEVTLKVEGNPM